jgi:hypothetical protein
MSFVGKKIIFLAGGVNNMFKIGSFENEILKSMEKSLVANQSEESNGFSKLAKAADYLNNAASIFDQAGMHEEAYEITEVLESLASKLIGNK